MLICNNCNTVNEDHVTRCGHCQMSGNFRRQMGDRKTDDVPVLQLKVVCRNCGSDAPGEEDKCTHCRFPLARVQVKQAIAGQTTAQPSSTISSTETQG